MRAWEISRNVKNASAVFLRWAETYVLFIHLFIYLFIYVFIYLFKFIYLFVYFYLFIYIFIGLFSYISYLYIIYKYDVMICIHSATCIISIHVPYEIVVGPTVCSSWDSRAVWLMTWGLFDRHGEKGTVALFGGLRSRACTGLSNMEDHGTSWK